MGLKQTSSSGSRQEFEEAGGEDVANAEIIAGAEPQYVVPVHKRLIIFAALPEQIRPGQHQGTHVGTGFDEGPEMTALFDEDRATSAFPAVAARGRNALS